MSTTQTVKDLVERFSEDREAFLSGEYNETQLRREFLDPFFECLGWDMFNKRGVSQLYKDVIHEDSLEIEGANKAPDYAFRIGGVRKFFVEAKKPAVRIETNIHPAFQLRRYAWSAKLPLSILTDFEEFAVYDCRTQPNKGDNAKTGRVKFFRYNEYVDRLDEIASTFSHDALLKGSLDQYVQRKILKGTAEVDDTFLGELERWRELLAINLAGQNRHLTMRALNYAVQMTIDRIIFLRICEDRGVEHEGQLKSIASGKDVYEKLCQLFQLADKRYNSGLFHFNTEKNQSSTADSLTLGLKINDEVLQDILKNLYYPESPYVFKEIPIDILGQVYERFLGKVIYLTSSRQVQVEEKPEVRKAGGVFYTPTYIVDYIVKNTVGKLVEGKTPKEVAQLKILDPACGSGSFALGAFQYLLNWHLDWYIASEPKKWVKGKNPAIFETRGGWQLTTFKKKEILLNNIFGVDIDPQAVEMTKLSLLLKVLEGETKETVGSQPSLWHERVLPDLGKNIQCGNALIGPDYYEARQLKMKLVDDEEPYRVNVFDWKDAFQEVFSEGGFDVVIGNPPYINTLLLEKILGPEIKPYWKKRFQSASGAFDVYVLFVERGVSILKSDGLLSFIMPNKFLAAEYAQEFRKWLHSNTTITSLLDFSSVKVWPISVYPVIPIFKKSKALSDTKVDIFHASKTNIESVQQLNSVPYDKLDKTPDLIWSFVTQPGADILIKCIANCTTLENVAYICGASTVAEGSEYPGLLFEDKEDLKETNSARFVVSGSILRYATSWNDAPVQFTHKKYVQPYIRLTAPMPKRRIAQAKSSKIIVCKVALEPRAFLDSEGCFVGAYTTYIFKERLSLSFIIGILNSKLMAFLYRNLYNALAMGGGYLRFQPPQLRRLPIPSIDVSSRKDKLKHDKMISLVERMLELHQHNPGTPLEKEILKREIQVLDRTIDRLVYELYGLTEDEIKIVEG